MNPDVIRRALGGNIEENDALSCLYQTLGETESAERNPRERDATEDG